ncbi:MAG: hypothetical protein Q4G14_13615 [Paracoccus sp. (in: a-proteobacteria)]|uniref:hypothetical protein n=1 Tax=Paracoccus sp. TaxID=267 RepID=UPI0026E08B75|nr:hypothetical protein [Paracoccus sp. (in: a-proteobacteria)]MDO5614263.1 hypothetical protein [Paracoccus sp. (in: a-proteobacteria)]
MRIAIALLGGLMVLSACASQPRATTAASTGTVVRMTCPAPGAHPASFGVAPAMQDRVRQPAYWRYLVAHGSNAELAFALRFAAERRDVAIPSDLVAIGRQAQSFRRANRCADLPDNPLI